MGRPKSTKTKVKEVEKPKSEIKCTDTSEKKENNSPKIFTYDFKTKTVHVPFEKIFKQDVAHLDNFNLKGKRTYHNIKVANDIVDAINDILTYDTNNTILYHYLVLKNLVDSGDIPKEDFPSAIYKYLFYGRVVDIVEEYVNKNYRLELDKNNTEKFSETLQYTDEQAKILLKISYGMKFIIPIVTHYITIYEIKNNKDYLINCYENLFNIYSESKHIDILTKLFESSSAKVNSTIYSDSVFWQYTAIKGDTPEITNNEMTKKLIIDIIPKYVFSEEANIISYNHVFFKYSLGYKFAENFDFTFKPLSLTNTDNTGLNDFDKFSINTAKVNESELVLNSVNIEETIPALLKKYNLHFKKEDIQFYIDNFKVNKYQKNLMFLYFAKTFGSTVALYNATNAQYIILLLILKEILLRDNYIYLPYIISGKVNNMNEKKIISKKQLNKIIESDEYKNLIKTKFMDTAYNIESGEIIRKFIATALNNKFFYLDPNKPEEEIKVDPDVLSDELIRFFSSI